MPACGRARGSPARPCCPSATTTSAHLRALLAERRARHPKALIATDGVFSMDGDLAPLRRARPARARPRRLADGGRCPRHRRRRRRPRLDLRGRAPADVPLQMGTLSKAIGAYGGYLCASAPVIELMKNRARTLSIRPACRPRSSPPPSRRSISSPAIPPTPPLPLAKAQAFTARAGLPRPHEPDRAGDRRRGRSGAGGGALSRSGGLPGGPDPPADGAGRHRAAALRLHRAPSDDGDIARLADLVRTGVATRGMTAVFVTATGTDIGKTFVARG